MKGIDTLLPVLFLSALLPVRAAPPLADSHVHYKWSQEEVTSAETAIQILRENDIALAVVIGTPATHALKLQRLAPDLIIPVWSPYQTPGDWSTWAFDKSVLQHARTALASGDYDGIGELHVIGGFAPGWDTPVISGLVELAIEHDIPLILHTEFSSGTYLTGLCRAYPELRILWAHAGALLAPAQVDAVMANCPNVWTDFSARDPWRYVNNPITTDSGELLTEWRRLIQRYPNRFLIGTDPVWPVQQMDSWDEPDTGWEHYGQFVSFHRAWLRTLPPELERRLRLVNAQELFGTPTAPAR